MISILIFTFYIINQISIFILHQIGLVFLILSTKCCRGSSIGCASAWFVDGRGFEPHVRQHSFVEIGHEKNSMAILSLPLIQEGQLSVTGERMCTK